MPDITCHLGCSINMCLLK